ncbi:autotransporter domain-containing protein [Labrys miyagiensis]
MSRLSRSMLCSVAALGALILSPIVPGAQAQEKPGTLRVLSFNTWREYFNSGIGSDASATSDFLTKGNYDVIALQELCYLSDCAYMKDIPRVLGDAGMGTYSGSRSGEDGVLSRIPGTPGEFVWGNYFSGQVAHFTTDAQNGIPQTTFVSAHFDWRDDPQTYRVSEAQTLVNWAAQQSNPILMMGDFNAGDVSERGLHTAEQQAYLFARTIVDSSSSDLWKQLASEYTPAGREGEYQSYVQAMQVVEGNGSPRYRNVIQAYFDAHRDEYPGLTSISDMSWRQWEEIIAKDMTANGLTFEDETYPVASNQPTTMNILKKQFIVLNSDSTREDYAPHTQGDGSVTWPTSAEENTATSWDRSAIDHFLASRPFGKWWKVIDDPTDPYLGAMTETDKANDGQTPLSDHALVAHELQWIGPALEGYAPDATKKTLVWGEEANTFVDDDKTFYLTRNNMRTDVHLGEVSDDAGNPILTGLTTDEKKSLLDCASKDPRFQQAIRDYCIDDHSFIGETLVKDKGILIVDEDAALGTSQAKLRLADGTLRVIGDEMNSLDRALVLEGAGGSLDVASAANAVTVGQTISGTGGLTKLGAGGVRLTGSSTYAGPTFVNQGALVVDGSVTSAVTVDQGAALGGKGTIGGLTGKAGSLTAPTGGGVLSVKGNVRFEQGSYYQVTLGENGGSSRLDATGGVTLNGGTLLVGRQDGTGPMTAAELLGHLDKTYTVLTADGVIQGRFDTAMPNYAFLDASLDYDPDRVQLTIERNDRSFASVGQTANQRAAGAGLESLGLGNALHDDFLVSGLDDGLATRLGSLSGEVNVSAQTALIEDASLLRDAAGDRLRASLGPAGTTASATATTVPADERMQFASLGNPAVPRASAPTATSFAADGLVFWGQGFGSWGRSGRSGNAVGMTRNSGGFLVGADTPVVLNDAMLRLGVLAGYSRTTFSTSGLGSGDSDNYHLGLYGGALAGPLALRAGAFYTWHDVSTSRTAVGQGLNADYRAGTAQVFGEAGYNMRFGGLGLEPFANLAYVNLRADSFHESGGSAALGAASSSTGTTFSTLGLRVSSEFEMAGMATRISATLGWRHAFGDTAPLTKFSFDGGMPFGVEGVPIARDALTAKAGVDVALGQSTTFNLSYGGQFARRGSFDQNVSGKLSVKF